MFYLSIYLGAEDMQLLELEDRLLVEEVDRHLAVVEDNFLAAVVGRDRRLEVVVVVVGT